MADIRNPDNGHRQNVRMLLDSDNVNSGMQTASEAIEFYNVSKQLFKGAAMNLHDWMSNREDVLNQIPEHDRANRERMKILGLTWTVHEDSLAMTCQIGMDSFLSKRNVLHQIASINDPLGLFCPVTLRGKLFLQNLWNQNYA